MPRSRPSCGFVRRSVSNFRRSSYCLAGSILRTAAHRRRDTGFECEMPRASGLQTSGESAGRPWAGTGTSTHHHHAFKSLSRLEWRVTDGADVAGRVGLMQGTDTAA